MTDASRPPLPPLRDIWFDGDGVRLHAVEAGDPAGPPVLMLHGFPEFWYGWHRQLGPLAQAGFRVVAVDQRGYNLSDKPPRVADYAIDRCAADAARVIEALGGRAAVVGHDWGGVVAWWFASTRPDLVTRFVALNAPHPAAMRRAMLTNPRQLLRSWYVFAMQLPWLPEWAASRNDFAKLAQALADTSRPGTFTADDLLRYREAWRQPGAYRATVNWYRAGLRHAPRMKPIPRVQVPTMILWGRRDRFIEASIADASAALCDDARLEFIDDATHWVQHEAATRVNARLIEFLR